MSRKRKKKHVPPALTPVHPAPSPVPESRMLCGYDAASWSPERHFSFWPIGDPRQPVSDFDLMTIYRRARALEANNPAVKKVVRTTVQVMGYMTPRPVTEDEEWNRRARELFLRWALNPSTFEVSGRLNFIQAQEWTERRAIIDGDVLSVSCTTPEGFPRIRFYQAPQLTASGTAHDRPAPRTPDSSRLRSGVRLGAGGRVTFYEVFDFTSKKVALIPAYRAFLYGHSNDPADPHHVSELVAVIPTAQDLLEINRLHKGQIKIGATFGIIETKSLQDPAPSASGVAGGQNPRMMKRAGQEQPVETTAQEQPEKPLVIDGNKAISLTPGRDLKMLHNSNPSSEVRAFYGDQLNSVAYGTASGLLHQVAFAPESLGGASARFVLSQTKDLADSRNRDRVNMLNFWWQHFIACAISSGQLQPCRDFARMWHPKWTTRSAWAIDYGRDINAFIALKGNNLTAASLFTEANYDMSYKELLELKARERLAEKEMAEKYGLSPQELLETPAGAAPQVLPQPQQQQETENQKENGNN